LRAREVTADGYRDLPAVHAMTHLRGEALGGLELRIPADVGAPSAAVDATASYDDRHQDTPSHTPMVQRSGGARSAQEFIGSCRLQFQKKVHALEDLGVGRSVTNDARRVLRDLESQGLDFARQLQVVVPAGK
jgi:hypothetical protein